MVVLGCGGPRGGAGRSPFSGAEHTRTHTYAHTSIHTRARVHTQGRRHQPGWTQPRPHPAELDQHTGQRHPPTCWGRGSRQPASRRLREGPVQPPSSRLKPSPRRWLCGEERQVWRQREQGGRQKAERPRVTEAGQQRAAETRTREGCVCVCVCVWGGGDRIGKMSIWGLERSGGRLGHENRCEDRVGVHARETREREDVGAQHRCRGKVPHFTSERGGARGPRRREGPLWMHRPQATLNHPLWAARSRSWVPCTGTARPWFLCVSPSRCLGNRLVAQQPALLSPCLEPGGLSGQQWSDGSYACLRPLPVQALGKGKEGAEEEGGWGIRLQRGIVLLRWNWVPPKPALGLERLRLTPSVHRKSLMRGKLNGCLG
ncbi:synaptotagmin-5 isoform X3 [Peromyscus californicus insignis]|uniref:synaptotagmin-5 isoform X3 n=1 Tax=Peromyscus californicus insignis TaxID=564181 RepID=UPI0022A6A363|nr:synaptotagmin-5 isoform X3 [Peromyscus californicus insignis]